MLVTLAMLAALCAMLVFAITFDGDVVWMGRRGGSWRAIPAWTMKVAVAAVLVPAISLLLWRLTLGAYLFSIAARPSSAGLSMEAGETIRWQGRQGIRALGRMHWLGIGVTGLVAVSCLFFLWQAVTADVPVVQGFLGSIVVLMLVGFPVIGVIVMHGGDVARLVLDHMAITDRRIIWLDRKGGIRREICGSDLIGAGVVEGDDQRGWVTVTTRRGTRIREIDLYGVPQPHAAVAAIDALMQANAVQR